MEEKKSDSSDYFSQPETRKITEDGSFTITDDFVDPTHNSKRSSSLSTHSKEELPEPEPKKSSSSSSSSSQSVAEEEEKKEVQKDSETMMLTETNNVYTPESVPMPSQSSKPEYSDEEISKAIDKMLKTKKSPPEDMIRPMNRYIKRETVLAAQERRYDDATKMEKAVKMLAYLTDPNSEFVKQQNKKKALQKAYDDAKAKLDQLEQKWKQTFKEFEEMKEDRIKSLDESHKQQTEQFEENWSNPEFLAPFKKPSQQLLQLRKMEENLAMAREFEQAKDIKKRAEKLEIIEARQQRNNAMVAMEFAYKQLEMQQQKETECLLMKEKRNRDELEKQKFLETQPYVLTLRRLESDLDPLQFKDQPHSSRSNNNPARPLRHVGNIHQQKMQKMLSIEELPVKNYIQTQKATQKRAQIDFDPRRRKKSPSKV